MTDTITTIDPDVALIIIDLQELIRTLPYTHPVGGVIDNAAALARAFRAAGKPVITTRVAGGTMPRSDRAMTLPSTIPAQQLALVPELDAQPSDIDVPKQHWGAFTDTSLLKELRSRDITQVVIVGVATGFGVESTARQASELGLNVLLPTDAMSDMNADVHDRAVTMIFPAMAECRTTAEVLAVLPQDH